MNKAIEKLLKERYYLKNETCWDDIAKRVSVIYPEIYEDIRDMRFIPSSPTLMNCNTRGERIGTLSSCFPMNIDDSIEGIFDALKEAAIVTKYGGGIGYDFSALRSSYENIESIKRVSSGPLSFVNIFNASLDGIRQGGVRRGAGLGLLSIYHPNIIEFILSKDSLNEFNRLNFSIKIPNQFYEDLKNNPNKIHQVQLKSGEWKDLIREEKKITVKQLWDLIVHQSWKTAEPGIFNESIAYNQCTVTNLSNIVIANACTEFTNIPYTSCALGSINLSKFIKNEIFNWKEFEQIIRKAVRFIDLTIDKNNFPLKIIEKTTKQVRAIGVGFMGLHSAMMKLKIPYNSKEAINFTKDISCYMTLCGMDESTLMAQEIGGYPAFDKEIFFNANKRFFSREKCRNIDIEQLKKNIEKHGIRNSSITSVAPTGTISFIADVSQGVEPVFALAYERKIEKGNKEYEVVYITDKVFEEYLNKNNGI